MDKIKLLLNRPKYEDNFLYSQILINSPQAFDVEVLDVQRGKKVTRVKLFLKNVNLIVWGIFFKFTTYHQTIFKRGAHIYIRGEVDGNQIVQPKAISKVNEIRTIYKPPQLIRDVKKVLLSDLSLLPEKIAKILYFMHNPRNFDDIEERRVLYGLKWAEIFLYLYKLEHKKVNYPAKPMESDYKIFLETLPFQLTRDQLKVIDEIKEDLKKPIQSRRVVIGDVGSGKTIVMLATAFMAKKSIIMCPTSILANQIYEEATKYLNGKFKVVLVTQKSKFSEEDLKSADLLIGTHALLYQELPEVNAIMVDEQHRFGTNQRAMLEKLASASKLRPHFFQFSATPIPRTQALIMSSFVNVSLIKTLPFKKEIDTKVISKEDFKDLIRHIQEQIAVGKQVVIVYPLVEESAKFAYQSLEEGKEFWLKYFEKVYITHGKDKEKEEKLIKFREDGNILLTTTVIEVGISLPKLSTIVIVGAERLGLATLHQLRGRVGRYGDKGYCFLYTNDKNNKRLQEFSSVLDGFKIAEMDLKYRKAGDILDGNIQSGETFNYFDETRDLAILEEVKEYISKME